MRFFTKFAFSLMIGISLTLHASNWKFGGFDTNKKDINIVFYDQASIVKTNSTTRFWIKSIPLSELNSYAGSKVHKEELIEEASQKIGDKYAPPFFELSSVRAAIKSEKELRERIVDAVLWEIIANRQGIRIVSRFCFEINCTQKMIRTVEGDLFNNQGMPKRKTGPMNQDWGYIAPDTTASRWSELLCPPQ